MNLGGWHPRTVPASQQLPKRATTSKSSHSTRSTSSHAKNRSRSNSSHNSHPHPASNYERPSFIQQPPSSMINNDSTFNNSQITDPLQHHQPNQFHENNSHQQQQEHPSYNPDIQPPTSGAFGGSSIPNALPSTVSKPAMNPPSAVPITKLELSISAKNLKDRDVFSKSDPVCVVFEAVHSPLHEGLAYQEVGRTEQIDDCLNPEWIKKVIINYMFEERQRVKFEIYDIDSDSQALSQHDFLGRAECDLADIVAAPFSTISLSLQKGSIIIHAEEINEGQNESMKFVIHGKDLDKKDFFGKSDPFLSFYRPIGGETKQLIHRTEVVKKSLNPVWKPFNLSVRALCQGDKDRNFIIECHDYDYDGDTKHDLIGVGKVNVATLASNDIREIELINEKKKAKKGSKYKNSGILKFQIAKLEQEYTFLDYIHGGLELDFTVSVDFTSSNGAITQPNSLHFCNPHSNNEYQMAIKAVLEICQAYNKTKNFTAFGFGAQIPPEYTVSHLFPLNLVNPQVCGIDGVMHAYATSLRNITFHGPTNFAPTINEAARRAAFYPPGGEKYQILLIITDGVISDMAQTKNAIVNASTLPLSIIIIGVGKAKFDKMNELDSDDIALTDRAGKTAKRDIVQFVPFRKFIKSDGVSSTPYEEEKLQYLLAKEVLAEVPTQIVSYMKARRYAPRQPQASPSAPPMDANLHQQQQPTVEGYPPHENPQQPVTNYQQPPVAAVYPQTNPEQPMNHYQSIDPKYPSQGYPNDGQFSQPLPTSARSYQYQNDQTTPQHQHHHQQQHGAPGYAPSYQMPNERRYSQQHDQGYPPSAYPQHNYPQNDRKFSQQTDPSHSYSHHQQQHELAGYSHHPNDPRYYNNQRHPNYPPDQYAPSNGPAYYHPNDPRYPPSNAPGYPPNKNAPDVNLDQINLGFQNHVNIR